MQEDDNNAEIEQLRRKQDAEFRLKSILQSIMDQPAYERLQNIRIADQSRYEKIAQALAMYYQQGQVRGKITDEQFRALLERLGAQGRESKITFSRK